jgi:hypothetical protein
MKIIYRILAGIACLSFASCEEIPPKQPGKITFEVKDDTGKPLAGIAVEFCAQVGIDMGSGGFGHDKSENHNTKTDIAGHAVIEFSGLSGGCVLRIDEPGYYVTSKTIHLNRGTSRLEPWNPTIGITVKRVLNPIAMFAKTVRARVSAKIPELGVTYSYDLETCDWLPPLGHGKTSDMCFKFIGNSKAWNDNNLTMEISMPNKEDGFIEFIAPFANRPSLLRSDYVAPERGYVQKIVRHIGRDQNKVLAWSETSEDRNFYFRVRTALDERGNIVSAHYGKIYGDFDFGGTEGGAVVFWGTTYLNPTSNDRNVEFDPKKNLIEGLDFMRKVQEP